jgi:hypothetical protein
MIQGTVIEFQAQIGVLFRLPGRSRDYGSV